MVDMHLLSDVDTVKIVFALLVMKRGNYFCLQI